MYEISECLSWAPCVPAHWTSDRDFSHARLLVHGSISFQNFFWDYFFYIFIQICSQSVDSDKHIFVFHTCPSVCPWDQSKPLRMCQSLVNHPLLDPTNAALKSGVFAKLTWEKLYITCTCQRHCLLERPEKRIICVELISLVCWPCLKYAINKVLY